MKTNECNTCAFKSQALIRLSEEEIATHSFNCALIGFIKGDAIIRQGMLSTNVAYLRKGLVKIHITGPYCEQIVRIVKAPGYLGLPATFGDKINQYSVTAIGDSEVCFIDLTTFRNLLRTNAGFSYEIVLNICSIELELYNRCANRSQKQIRGKISDVLLEMADDIYDADDFNLPINQEELGNLIDSSRESVSRVLTEFEKDGIISISGKRISIKEKKKLQMISSRG
ncbi:MAG: Crp/Fnr family transcriptional regulator [Bacteroidales bacterium]|jgi:CRP/FNR family transcriptional regulator|nr:Crp/Fnr family transcriptional regulator [Bacteroidales bacterium]